MKYKLSKDKYELYVEFAELVDEKEPYWKTFEKLIGFFSEVLVPTENINTLERIQKRIQKQKETYMELMKTCSNKERELLLRGKAEAMIVVELILEEDNV